MATDSSLNNIILGLPGNRNLNGFILEEGTNNLGTIDVDISPIEEAIISNEYKFNPEEIESAILISGKLINYSSIGKYVNQIRVEFFNLASPSTIIAKSTISDIGKFEVVLDLADFELSIENLCSELGALLYYNEKNIPLFTLPLFITSESTIDLYIEADLLKHNNICDFFPNVLLNGNIYLSEQNINCSEIFVRFFSIGINEEILIGSSLIKEDYSFETELFIAERSATLIAKCYSLNGDEVGISSIKNISGIQILKSEDSIKSTLDLSITLNTGITLTPDEYTRYSILLTRMFGPLTSISPTQANITYINQKSGIAKQNVSYILTSVQTYTSEPIDQVILYALFRTGMPEEPSQLKSSDAILLDERIENSVSWGIIDEAAVTTEKIDDAKSAIYNELNQYLLTSQPFGSGVTFDSILDTAGVLDTTQKSLFTKAYNQYTDYTSFWTDVSTIVPGLTESEIKELRFTFQIAGLSLGTAEFIDAFKALYSSSLSEGTSTLSNWTRTDFEDFIQDVIDDNSGRDVFPEVVPGSSIAQKKVAFARSLNRIIEHTYPTQSLVNRLSESPSDFHTKLSSFTTSNPSFTIGANSIQNYLADNPSALTGISDPEEFTQNLITLQTRFLLSPGFERHESIKALEETGVNSSHDIVNLPWAEFSKKYTNAGGSEEVAGAAYEMAARNSAIVQQFQKRYGTDLSTPTYATAQPELLQYIDDNLANDPNLKTLFGSQDYCECSHCRSIYSPSSYIVDVFQFLDKIPATEESELTCWDVLEERRPDLCELLLNCENANTALPYIDLLNEILENGIAVSLGQTPDYSYQTTLKTDELLALPEHVRTSVYSNTGPLVTSFYPWNLPFDLWSETGRTYLANLKIKRYSMMEKFFQGDIDNEFSDAGIVDEILGLSGRDRNILLGDPIDASWYFDHAVWGLETATPFVIELRNVDNLLDYSGISFDELKQLLKTHYINPTGELTLVYDAADSCDLELAKLQYKNSSDVYTDLTESGTTHSISDHQLFMRIARFYRLKSRLGWSIRDLDIVIKSLNGLTSDAFSEELLANIAIVVRIQSILKKPISQIMCIWGDIFTGHVNDLPNERSPYALLFQNKTVINPVDSAFNLNATLTELAISVGLIEDHLPSIRQGLGISMDDLIYLINNTAVGSVLNLSSLSFLYRHTLLAKALKLSVKDLISHINLTGIDLFSTDDNWMVIRFTEYISNIKSARIKAQHLRYIQKAYQEVSEGIAYKTSDLKLKLVSLRKELDQIILTNVAPNSDPRNEFLAAKLGIIYDIKTTDTNLDNISQIIDSTDLPDYNNQLKLVFGIDESVVDISWTSLDITLTSPEVRLAYLLNAVTKYIIEVQSENLLVDFVVDTFKLKSNVAGLILNYPNSISIESNSFTLSEVLKKSENYVFVNEELTDSSKSILAFSKIHKLSLIVNLLKLSFEEIRFVLKGQISVEWDGWIDPALILSATNENTDSNQYENLSLIVSKLFTFFTWTRKYKNADKSILEIIENLFLDSDLIEFQNDLILTTGWDNLDYTLLVDYFGFTTESMYSEDTYLKLANCFEILKLTGGSASQIIAPIHGWIEPNLSPEAAVSIIQGVKSVNEENSWSSVAKAIRDILREKQRDALCDYLLHNQSGINSKLDLFNYYLVDPEMGACALTSRLRLAMSSAQLFVQRCLMNLEDDVSVQDEHYDLWNQWKWMKRYRVWEANRKVFTYPENWIEPELRDDKSEFFKELEAELAQVDINNETATKAYLNYLKKLEGVSNMEIMGICSASDDADNYSNGCYIFGRKVGKPTILYFRKYNPNRTWTNWEKIDNDFEGNHLIPILFNNKLFIFWPIILFKPAGQENNNAHIQLAWSEYENGNWTARRMSENRLIERNKFGLNSKDTDEGDDYRFFFSAFFEDGKSDELIIRALRKPQKFLPNSDVINSIYYEIGSFKVDFSRNVSANSIEFSESYFTPIILDAIGPRNISYQTHTSYKSFSIAENFTLNGNSIFLNLIGDKRSFSVMFMHDDSILKDDTNVINKPFIYKDSKRTYYVRRENDKYVFENLYHPYIKDFIRAIYKGGIDSLLNPGSGETDEFIRALRRQEVFSNDFVEYYTPTSSVSNNYPIKNIDFSSNGSYSSYNWELFFHIPMYIAGKLSQNQKFEEANKWYQYVFDPTDASAEYTIPQRFWKVKPFMDVYNIQDGQPSSINELMAILAYGGTEESDMFEQQVQQWRENPFNPHLIARSRLFAYQKNVVMKYIDNLISWADMLFRQDTIESTNEATQLYLLAQYILGERPRKVDGKTPDDMTYCELKESGLDGFSNAMVQLESRLTLLLNRSHTYGGDRGSKNVLNPDLDNLAQIGSGQGIFKTGLGFDDPKTALSQPSSNKRYVPTSSEAGRFQTGMSWNNGSLITHNPIHYNKGYTTLIVNSLYFCIPANDKLISYWDLISDRLYKLRHCMDIDGRFRQLPLYDPPIDPALLVRATASGLDLNSIISNLYAPLPNYRFAYTLSKAKEFAGIVKSLGQSLLSAFEKRDSETLTLLRSTHEIELLEAMTEMKKLQLNEAKTNIKSLESNLKMALNKLLYYGGREKLNESEKSQLIMMQTGLQIQNTSSVIKLAGAALSPIPEIQTAAGLMAFIKSSVISGEKLGSALSIVGDALNIISGTLYQQASISGIIGSYKRRSDDWTFQKQLADDEIKMIEQQIIAAEIRSQISENDLENHRLNIDQKESELDFMKSKFSNEDLYNWMITQLSITYFQSYQLAYKLALQAERCYTYEIADSNDNFVSFGYWDSLKKGLLSAEKLEFDLLRMETSYMEKNKRMYELTKQVSLAMWNPDELLKLRETGKCSINLFEEMFDLDHPGHYLRRIKSVSISIPCVAGPYTGVSGKLTLFKNSIRKSNETTEGYSRLLSEETSDNRFVDNLAAIQSIATSSGQNDSGMFNLNFNDERYLPFEGAGVISEWEFELPNEYRNFDYDTISDVILTINYMAKDGGETLKVDAVNNLGFFINPTDDTLKLSRMFSMKYDFGNEWYIFINGTNPAVHSTEIVLKKKQFPFYLKSKALDISSINVYIQGKETDEILEFNISTTTPGTTLPIPSIEDDEFGDYIFFKSFDVSGLLEQDSDLITLFLIGNDEPWDDLCRDLFIEVIYSAS